MEVEFGNVGSMFRGFEKFRLLKVRGIQLAILVMPSKRLAGMIDGSTQSFDVAYGVMTLDQPPMPFVLVELDLTDLELDEAWNSWLASYGHIAGVRRP